ncbi:PDZ domain-containing protein [Aquimarina agarivorans]|uniref:M61 family metallopeptidase n=1 Tax=Aquimarina agarivorans TaxID=980584 RepID=UPI000248E5DF|nr:PDZ domain-containing protein [Aquimarina agarivorans]
MKFNITLILILVTVITAYSQVKNIYSISFDNVAHHEASIKAKFSNLQPGNVTLKMAKKSPGSFGFYQFSQNIYNFRITDESGKELKFTQPKLGEWLVEKHKGQINISYKLFGDTRDGVFSHFSEDQVILNNPSAFIYVPKLASRPVKLKFNSRDDLKWKIATQLKDSGENIYEAENLNAFMDSPIFAGNFNVVQKTLDSGGKQFELKIAIIGSEGYATELLNKVTEAIKEQYKVFGSYPDFSNGTYLYILSFKGYNQNMAIEHKSSSILLNSNSVAELGTLKVLESMLSLFAKTYNKTRIRPVSLEPFNLQENVQTSEYWFSEGFSKYYGLLSMVRARIISEDKYLEKVSYILNDVIKSTALKYNNTLEMSKKSAYFASNLENNTALNAHNLYIPYEDHGFVIALLLDLKLRDKENLSLDDFISLIWTKYGKTNKGYTNENIYATLREYAGDFFASDFYKDYIIKNTEFDFQKILESMGINISFIELPYLGAEIAFNDKDLAEIVSYTIPGTPAYESGLEKGDIIISLDNKPFSNLTQFKNALNQNKIGKKVSIKYSRNGVEKDVSVKLAANPNTILTPELKISSKVEEKKRGWIGQ